MSKNMLAACLVIATALTSSTFAVTPSSRDTGSINYSFPAEDLGGWHLAAYVGTATRNGNIGAFKAELDIERYNMVLGYDISRWFTVYGLAGATKVKPSDKHSSGESSSSGIFGVGTWINLIESDQLSRLATITRYRVSSGAEVSYADFDDFSWTQFDAFLTFEIQNEINCPAILLEAIGIFFGPVASYVESADFDQDSSNTIGFTAGLNIMFTDDTYLTIAGDFFSDDSAVYGMVGVRF